MNLVTFNPEHVLDRFFDTDRYFGFPKVTGDHSSIMPRVNVIEKDEAFHLEAETPGMTEKDVSVEFHDGILTLKGHRENSSESDKNDYRIREFSKQSFSRSFRLSDQVDSEKVEAKMEQGILKVTLPKKEQVKPKKIEIKVES
ncbi:MAG: Hsp20/alpha crystallin family protein [Nitrospinae bacterium]|nr:Hsp20/alpha crystallin family protein [Nitrospinota bacterium]